MSSFDSLLKFVVFRERLELLRARKKLYDAHWEPDKICKLQLEKLNSVWNYAYKNIFFYERWKRQHRLPNQIISLNEMSHFPELTKSDLNENRDVNFGQFSRCRTVGTGGSSGEVTFFPVRDEDFLSIYADAYVGRSWWGVEPLDLMVSFWGHSHLFGKGFKGTLNEYKRRLKDRMVNNYRLSAYDMRPKTIVEYHRTVSEIRPVVISGYTSCLYKLARYMIDHGLQRTAGDRLKVVIPTSETVSGTDLAAIEQAFGSPVAIEYGMAETGIIAHSRSETRFMPVFWNSFFCRVDKRNTLFVSTTTNRLFPLINYRTDDRVTPFEIVGESVLALTEVQGREQGSFTLATTFGEHLLVSAILLAHIMKGYPHVYSVHGEQLRAGKICVYLVSDRPLSLDLAHRYLVEELRKDYPELEQEAIILYQNDDAHRSIAGKEIVKIV